MTHNEFAQFAAADDIGNVVFYRPCDVPDAWEIWAYDVEGSRSLALFGNRLHPELNERVMYGSLDDAFAVVRSLGCMAPISIEVSLA